MSKWIPVSEKLPELTIRKYGFEWSDMVLVYGVTENGERGIGISQYCYEPDDDDGWCDSYIYIDSGFICEVLAWMPLPEPYTEE